MTTPLGSADTQNPQLSAEEIGKRFLELIEGLRSRDDLSLERVQEVTGASFQHNVARGLSHYGVVQENGWRLGIFLYHESPGHKKRVSLQVDQFGESMPSTICALGFERYHNEFSAMGFYGSPVHGEHGQLEYWHYYKPDDLSFQILIQHAMPEVPGVTGPLCIRSISMLD